jgi:ABC-type multidrug transport system ATPase subunit
MGLKSAFLSQHVASILEFSGLQDKANHRLHTLSSGQRIRLGFAISTSVQHDIMLMDEWVGTGDADFMARAKERMQSRVGGSKIVVLASHSISLLNDICNKGIVLEQGRLVHAGSIRSALKAYHEVMRDFREQREAASRHEDEPVSVYGRVAALVERGDGFLVVEGWCVDGEGRFPQSLALELDGQQHFSEEVVRVSRPDVMKQFGLVRDDCGFRARFTLPEVPAIRQLDGIRVLAVTAAGRAGPLQIAPGVFQPSKQTVSSGGSNDN